MQALDTLISPLLKKGQSLAHIYASHSELLSQYNCGRRTLYRYLDKNVFSAKNIDLPRKVKYKPRKENNTSRSANRSYRIGRTYDDFMNYQKFHLETPIVEMDTVEGKKGGKVLLTLLFRSCNLMIAILLTDKTQQSVINALDQISKSIGVRRFKKLFPIILTDYAEVFSVV